MSDDVVGRRATALESATTAPRIWTRRSLMADRIRACWPTPRSGRIRRTCPCIRPPLTHRPRHRPGRRPHRPSPDPKRRRRLRWGRLFATPRARLLAAAATGLRRRRARGVDRGVAPPRDGAVRSGRHRPGARRARLGDRDQTGRRLARHAGRRRPARRSPGDVLPGLGGTGGDYVPLGTFHLRQPGEVELWAGVAVDEVTRLEVTRQRMGGAQTPGEVILVGTIPHR